MNWLRKTGTALALQGFLAVFLLMWQIVAPASSVVPSQVAVAAEANAKTLPIVLVSSFNLDLSAKVGASVFPLGNLSKLQNFVVRADQPLPSVPINTLVSVSGTTATTTGVLVVANYDPFVLSLTNLKVTLATGQTVTLPDVTQTIPMPINSPFSMDVPAQVPGIGDVTFTLSGSIAAIRFRQ